MKTYHNPPHIYLDNTIYKLTGCTYNKITYFDNDHKKQILKNKIFESIKFFDFILYAWVILDNHYHILFQIKEGKQLSNFVKLIHGGSSYELNKVNHGTKVPTPDRTEVLIPVPTPKRKIWYSYWDTCIKNEKEFWIYLNYIHNNPIKHNYIKNLEELEIYQFSSYPEYLKEKGKQRVIDIFSKYPIVDFTDESDKELVDNGTEVPIPVTTSAVSLERLNLIGVQCPINFVRIKLKLEEMEEGKILEVILDEGEPIKNVPRAVKEEGHKIISVENRERTFILLIEKGGG